MRTIQFAIERASVRRVAAWFGSACLLTLMESAAIGCSSHQVTEPSAQGAPDASSVITEEDLARAGSGAAGGRDASDSDAASSSTGRSPGPSPAMAGAPSATAGSPSPADPATSAQDAGNSSSADSSGGPADQDATPEDADAGHGVDGGVQGAPVAGAAATPPATTPGTFNLVCAQEYTLCSTVTSLRWVECVADAEQCGLLPSGTTACASDFWDCATSDLLNVLVCLGEADKCGLIASLVNLGGVPTP